jgi:hypothetical protein
LRDDPTFVDGLAGRSEIPTLTVGECDGVGRIVRTTVFDVEEEDLVYAAFDACAAELNDQYMRVLRDAVSSSGADRTSLKTCHVG